jgi:hypothetical protein
MAANGRMQYDYKQTNVKSNQESKRFVVKLSSLGFLCAMFHIGCV